MREARAATSPATLDRLEQEADDVFAETLSVAAHAQVDTNRLAAFSLALEQVRQAMLAQGLPEDVPDRLLGSLADYAKQPGPSSDTVEQVLGRPARSFAEWAAEHAASFRN